MKSNFPYLRTNADALIVIGVLLGAVLFEIGAGGVLRAAAFQRLGNRLAGGLDYFDVDSF